MRGKGEWDKEEGKAHLIWGAELTQIHKMPPGELDMQNVSREARWNHHCASEQSIVERKGKKFICHQFFWSVRVES